MPVIKSYIDQEKLGVKTNKGFYDYPNPEFSDPSFIYEENESEEIYSYLISAVILNALLLAANGIASIEEIDQAWIIGTFLSTGPFSLIKQMSIATLQSRLKKLIDTEIVTADNVEIIIAYIMTKFKPSKQRQEASTQPT